MAELILLYALQLQDFEPECGIPEVQAETAIVVVDWIQGSADGRVRQVNVGDSPDACAQPRWLGAQLPRPEPRRSTPRWESGVPPRCGDAALPSVPK